MTWKDFVKRAHFYFKKPSLPNDSTFGIWQEEIGGYPDAFFDWAWDTAKSREDRLPENIPRWVKELWQEWLKRNPQKRDRSEFFCKQRYCEDGLLYVVNGHCSYVFRCEECNSRDDLPQFPLSTVSALKLQGYQSNSVENTLKRKPEYDPVKWGKTGKGEWISQDVIEKAAKEWIAKNG